MATMYRVQTNDAAPATADTMVHWLCSTTKRVKLSEYVLSSDASPVEQSCDWTIVRTTSVGTTAGATLTVESSDPLSQTSAITVEGNGYATEPTVGDTLMRVGVHQKATFRWVAYPGREIQSVAAASNGMGIVTNAFSTVFSVNVSAEWEE